MELDQTEFEQYVVRAHEEVNDYIEKEARRFYKEQPSSWRHKPQLLPTYVQTINFDDQFIQYRFFDDLATDEFLGITAAPEQPPYIVSRIRIEKTPDPFWSYHNGSFPLVPGLLAILVNYFLDAGYTPLVDAKEK